MLRQFNSHCAVHRAQRDTDGCARGRTEHDVISMCEQFLHLSHGLQYKLNEREPRRHEHETYRNLHICLAHRRIRQSVLRRRKYAHGAHDSPWGQCCAECIGAPSPEARDPDHGPTLHMEWGAVRSHGCADVVVACWMETMVKRSRFCGTRLSRGAGASGAASHPTETL